MVHSVAVEYISNPFSDVPLFILYSVQKLAQDLYHCGAVDTARFGYAFIPSFGPYFLYFLDPPCPGLTVWGDTTTRVLNNFLEWVQDNTLIGAFAFIGVLSLYLLCNMPSAHRLILSLSL